MKLKMTFCEFGTRYQGPQVCFRGFRRVSGGAFFRVWRGSRDFKECSAGFRVVSGAAEDLRCITRYPRDFGEGGVMVFVCISGRFGGVTSSLRRIRGHFGGIEWYQESTPVPL